MGKKKSMSELKQDSEGINHWVPSGTPHELLCRSALYGLVYDPVNGYLMHLVGDPGCGTEASPCLLLSSPPWVLMCA